MLSQLPQDVHDPARYSVFLGEKIGVRIWVICVLPSCGDWTESRGRPSIFLFPVDFLVFAHSHFVCACQGLWRAIFQKKKKKKKEDCLIVNCGTKLFWYSPVQCFWHIWPSLFSQCKFCTRNSRTVPLVLSFCEPAERHNFFEYSENGKRSISFAEKQMEGRIEWRAFWANDLWSARLGATLRGHTTNRDLPPTRDRRWSAPEIVNFCLTDQRQERHCGTEESSRNVKCRKKNFFFTPKHKKNTKSEPTWVCFPSLAWLQFLSKNKWNPLVCAAFYFTVLAHRKSKIAMQRQTQQGRKNYSENFHFWHHNSRRLTQKEIV